MTIRKITELIGREEKKSLADQWAKECRESGAWIEVWVEGRTGNWKVKGTRAVASHV